MERKKSEAKFWILIHVLAAVIIVGLFFSEPAGDWIDKTTEEFKTWLGEVSRQVRGSPPR